MRIVKWIALALLLAAPICVPTAAGAATPSLGLGMTAGTPNVVEAAGRCGRYSHYVGGHRARNGRWIRGHCVRNRRHR